ncbi:MAG: E3 binding domain-containing protein [Thermoanaerobacteraceae bacterium]|nr:E3 binding domain-containing protein [Thermoanaerobacteraceae bacterium]
MVTGTGPGGRITEEDVKKYIEGKGTAAQTKEKNTRKWKNQLWVKLKELPWILCGKSSPSG